MYQFPAELLISDKVCLCLLWCQNTDTSAAALFTEFFCVHYWRNNFIIETEPSSTNLCKHPCELAAPPSMHHLYGALPSSLHCAESRLHSLF